MAGTTSAFEAVEVHHRVQASLVDLVEELVRKGGDRALAEETITRLVDFTAAHFQTEERLMRQLGYPQAGAHGDEHARLLEVVRAIRAAHASQEPGAGRTGELRSWLADHISTMDAAFVEWCTASGARPV